MEAGLPPTAALNTCLGIPPLPWDSTVALGFLLYEKYDSRPAEINRNGPAADRHGEMPPFPSIFWSAETNGSGGVSRHTHTHMSFLDFQ